MGRSGLTQSDTLDNLLEGLVHVLGGSPTTVRLLDGCRVAQGLPRLGSTNATLQCQKP